MVGILSKSSERRVWRSSCPLSKETLLGNSGALQGRMETGACSSKSMINGKTSVTGDIWNLERRRKLKFSLHMLALYSHGLTPQCGVRETLDRSKTCGAEVSLLVRLPRLESFTFPAMEVQQSADICQFYRADSASVGIRCLS